MKKVLYFLSAVLLVAVLAIPCLAEFPLEDFRIPDTGVHFAFNGDAKDEFGNVTGKLVGSPTFVKGRDGKANGAIYLASDKQYVFIGKVVDAESYTASFWCKVAENKDHVFLCSSEIGSIRIIQDGGEKVGITINGVADSLSVYTAPRDEWVNLTFVYANEAMDIYADGELVGNLKGALPLPFTLIGNDAEEQMGWQSEPYLTIDDAWFFGRAFSADEVKALYNGKLPAAPVTPGQVIGQVLATDIRAYINGAEIPAYNIDGKLAILVSDLNNYGFDTSFSNSLRKSTVTRDKSQTRFTSVPSKASGLKVGTPVMSVFSTDIVVELDGKLVNAFNVDNRMAIYFSELGKYGTVVYNNSTRSSTLTLN